MVCFGQYLCFKTLQSVILNSLLAYSHSQNSLADFRHPSGGNVGVNNNTWMMRSKL